jgi:hypothetical protein
MKDFDNIKERYQEMETKYLDLKLSFDKTSPKAHYQTLNTQRGKDEDSLRRESLVEPLGDSKILNIQYHNSTFNNKYSTDSQLKYKIICDKLMMVSSKYCKGKGKVENLPTTIEAVFKKNKLIYEHLRYLSNIIGMDCRQYSIEAIGEEIARIKNEHAKIVSVY